MPVSATAVRIGKPLVTGGVLNAPLGTALPVDGSVALNVAFVAVGYCSDDGVVQTIDADSTDIKAWGGDIVRTIQTSHKVTFKFTMIETGLASLAAYYGDANVTGTTSPFTVKMVAGDLPHKPWVIEIRDGLTARIRISLPDANITDRGDVSYKDDDAVAYEVTLTAYPDANGVKAYLYIV